MVAACDPDIVQRSIVYTSLLVLIVICEELVWRSMVLGELTERFGTRRAWPLAALCYGLTALPTLYTLRDPLAGLNPLLVTAALGCGIVWSFLASFKGRLVPSSSRTACLRISRSCNFAGRSALGRSWTLRTLLDSSCVRAFAKVLPMRA